MKIKVNKTDWQGAPVSAILEHNEEIIEWNIALYDKIIIKKDYDIFDQINKYWEYLPKATQDQIFAIYKRTKEVFDNTWDSDQLTKELYTLIADLYQFHELTDIRHWVNFHSDLALPRDIDLREVFVESDETPGTRERTYLKEDYKWLVTLSIALRVVIPIWGEFISRTRKETGTVFKEYYAFKLLSYSSIARSEPMERLRIYVEHSLQADKSKAAAVLGGISSEDFPTWILALVLVRCLSIGDVRGLDPTSSLITFIYKYIRQKVQGHDNSFIGMVKDKSFEGQGQEGENNLSKLENYKIKQDIPAGDLAIIEYYMQNIDVLATKICPDVDLALLSESTETVSALESELIWKPQITLIQWVLKPVVPPRGVLHLNKLLCLRAMAVTQTLLWHRGHFELAGLVSAIIQKSDDELQLAGTDSRARIPKDLAEKLDSLFPYARKLSGKQNLVKRQNPATEAIDSVANLFSEHNWRLTLPQEWVSTITGSNSRLYSVPHNIKILLAKLAIAVAERSF